MAEKIEPGVLEPAELAIRESIVLPYVQRQAALYLETGYHFNNDTNPSETFDRTQAGIRALYAEPAGKLALSLTLWQRGSVNSKTGDITWEFRHPDRGERLANRLESVLVPVGEPVLPRIEKVAQNESARNARQTKPNVTRVVGCLQRIWTRYGTLEEEYRAAQTELPFVEYILDTRAYRFPEFWYQKWCREERYTTVSYVPGTETTTTTVDDIPDQEPEPEARVQTPEPDLAVITQAIARLPEPVAGVMQCFLMARQNRLDHNKFSELLQTDSRDATMRLAAAFQEAPNWLEPAEYAALTAMRYL